MKKSGGDNPASSRKNNIFRNQDHQKHFEQYGYVLSEFLQSDNIERLKKMFNDIISVEREMFEFAQYVTYYISVLDRDVAMKREVDSTVKEMITDRIEEVFIDYRVMYCNFIAKKPGGGEVWVHQDNTFVDEDLYTAFNLWIPLEDTGPLNGGFHLIPGSHKLFTSYRAGSIRNNLTLYNESIKKYMSPVPLKAGGGLVFDQQMVHYTPDNGSDTWRPALVIVLIPSESQPVLTWYDEKDDPDHVGLYKIDENYIMESGLWSPPTGLELLMKKKYDPLPPEQEILQILNRHLQSYHSV